MVIEAIVIAFCSFWLANEYAYNVYFRIYVDSVFIQHLTSYTIAIGLGIGLAGTAVAAALYKTMQEAKVKLEAITPRIKGSVEKLLTSLPTADPKASASASSVVISTPGTQPLPVAEGAPVSPARTTEEEK